MASRLGVAQAGAGTGTVSGRVVCSDTNGPARLASVTLVPAVAPETPATKGHHAGETTQTLTIQQTGLDGSFVIRNVPVGNYYVVAEKPGYRSAMQISREQMKHPAEAVAGAMAQLLTPVRVAANRGSTAEVRLIRGATVSGTIRFDDGSPDTGATVQLWRRGEDGKGWVRPHQGMLGGSGVSAQTDDQGRYRISGLAAGEYLVDVQLQVTEVVTTRSGSGDEESEGWSSRTKYTMEVYAPRAVRKKDAKPIKLSEGEESEGAVIEIPLSTLHTVSGSLAEQGSGRPVNAGKVSLVFADDGTELASADVGGEGDEEFHLAYVPEGEYRLKVSHAADVVRTEVSNGVGVSPPTHTETKVVRSFGDAEQPLVVESDLSGVVVAMPAAAKGTAALEAP